MYDFLYLQDSKVADTLTSFVEGELDESQCMTLVYRQDGITKLTLTHLMALTPQAAVVCTCTCTCVYSTLMYTHMY